MPQIINTNILALNAQRQLNKSQSSQATSIERLSSGLRINSAKDDAAGLAISTRFETQVRGLNQAIRNANDGISLAQAAEGSLQEMGSIMQRMRELAVQSANDTNSSQDRLSLQAEVDQLYSEIERISDSTEFNGVNILDGTAGERTFQVGANANQSISFELEAVTTEGLDLNNFSGTGELNGGRVSTGQLVNLAANTITINDVALDATTFNATATEDNITELKNLLNDQTQSTGVTAEAYNIVTGTASNGTTSGLTFRVGAAITAATDTVIADSSSIEELAANINRDLAGVTATITSEGAIQLQNDTGQSIEVRSGQAGSGLTVGTYNGYLSLTSNNNTEIKVGVGTEGSVTNLQALGFNVSEGSDNVTGQSALFNAAGITAGITETDDITINGIEIGAVAIDEDGTAGFDIAKAINDVSAQTGVTASIGATVVTSAVTAANFAAAGEVNVNGIEVSTATPADLDALVIQVNAALSATTDIVATDDGTNLILTSASGVDINIDQDVAAFTPLAADGTTNIYTAALTLESEGEDILVSSNATTEAFRTAAVAKLGLTRQGGDEDVVSLGLNITTVANANAAIEKIDSALDQVSSVRAGLGAFQNRLGSTISNLENVSQNISAANSRIRDADFAVETANLTKTQILQQAGIAMLSQANASQQNVLSLLG